jgi:hypothetical protein
MMLIWPHAIRKATDKFYDIGGNILVNSTPHEFLVMAVKFLSESPSLLDDIAGHCKARR